MAIVAHVKPNDRPIIEVGCAGALAHHQSHARTFRHVAVGVWALG